MRMHLKKVAPFALLVLLLCLIAIFRTRPDIPADPDLGRKLEAALAHEGKINLEQVSALAWTDFVVMTPYSDPHSFEAGSGVAFPCQVFDLGIEYRDDAYWVVLINIDRAVAWTEISSPRVLFRGLPQTPIPRNHSTLMGSFNPEINMFVVELSPAQRLGT